MQQSLFSRVKRQASSVKIGNLQSFRASKGNTFPKDAYLQFIDELKSVLTEPNEIYGNIKVTKRDDGITKVIMKDDTTQVEFIYLNRNLYIIGFITGSTFYIDKQVYEELGKRIPNSWTRVIGSTTKVEALSTSLSYGNIWPSGAHKDVDIGKLGDSLTQLTKLGDSKARPGIISNHVAPFVVAFSEAIRFPIVARKVQDAIRVKSGTFNLSENLLGQLSIGHPDERCDPFSLSMKELLLNWGKLSDIVPLVYEELSAKDDRKKKNSTEIVIDRCTLHLEGNQLNTILGVANSNAFERINTTPGRGKRDLTSMFDTAMPQHPALLEQQINRIDYDGNLKQPYGIASITHSPDVIGALHLLTVGLLYLYGRKMNVPVGNNPGALDPREAFGIATDLADRIGCFFKFAGMELEIGFEEEMQLRRQLSSAILNGEPVGQILTELLYQHYSKLENDGSLEALRELLSKALARDSGLVEEDAFQVDECFPSSQSTV